MTVKVPVEVTVPLDAVTVISPVVAPTGTLVVIFVAEVSVAVAVVPLNETPIGAVKPVPVIVTFVAGGPLVGVKLVIVGAEGVAVPTVARKLMSAPVVRSIK